MEDEKCRSHVLYNLCRILTRTPAIVVARFLIQALSNLVTGHEELMNNLWETYLNLPEDQVVIMCVLNFARGTFTKYFTVVC